MVNLKGSKPMPADSDYREYCRPKLADLLRALRLDREYVRASGTRLTDREGREVLDLIGGFGAAVLGHNPPELVSGLVADLQAGVPSHAQCSSREEAGRLARKLSDLTGVVQGYRVNFSNSGAEAVEAAIKHAYKVRFDLVRREYERITRALHDFYNDADAFNGTIVLPEGKNLIDFRDDLDEYNLGQFELFQNQPVAVVLKGSYHGKTTSALKATFNKSYREGFEGLSAIRAVFVDPNSSIRVAEAVADHGVRFLVPILDQGSVEVREVVMTRVFVLMLEVVLGEGGMRPLEDASLSALGAAAKRLAIPLLIDEVQTGCGRLGAVFGFQATPLASVEPEYLCLSKALGGGMVKIGATLIRRDVYDPDFGILHTSTFAEDELSCRTASRFLDQLTGQDGYWLTRIRDQGNLFLRELQGLREEYPDVVKNVRGRGLMLGLELQPLADKSPFFRATGKQGILSLLVASYLLHYHGIRLLAPLSTILKGNPGKVRLSVLRIQPPASIGADDIARVVTALREVCRIIRANHEYCLVAHLLGIDAPKALRADPPQLAGRYPLPQESGHIDARTGFVVHPTRLEYLVEYYFPSSRGLPFPDESLHRWWTSVCRFLEPQHVHHSLVKSHGFVVENSLVFVPYLPDYLVNTSEPKLVEEIRDKVQDAVTIARERGDDNIPVGMVGLGAYTSIVTQNCTRLNDYEVSVTSGNSYTVALTLLGLLRAAEEQRIDPTRACAAVVGATGNIGLVLSQFLVLAVSRLILVGRGKDGERKLGYARLACIETLLRAIRDDLAGAGETRLTGLAARLREAVEPAWPGLFEAPDALGDFVRDGVFTRDTVACLEQILEAEGQLESTLGDLEIRAGLDCLTEADLVVAATNSPDPELIRPDMVRRGAVVCCTSVPSNLGEGFHDSDHQILAFDGGLAHLPPGARLDFVGMPGGDLIYGCLAETLALGFEGSSKSFCKGNVTMAQVEFIMAAAQRHGFGLGQLKLGERPLRQAEPLAVG
jgi:acetylornithine/succinyldiaminopimelate/putrescine aminotransferase/predicted amino acid dehydrogenase